jgi:hypothetical protein
LSSPEDIIRERERAKACAEVAARERSQRQVEEERRREVDKIRRYTELVLARLADRDYPEGKVLRVFTRMTFFGREKYIERAAWKVCEYGSLIHGDEVSGKVYLLSDGSFAFTPRGFTAILDLEEVVLASGSSVLPSLGGISEGLKELLARHA